MSNFDGVIGGMSGAKRDWRIEKEIKDLLSRANMERVRGNYEKALEIIKHAHELSPDDPQVLELFGDILRARGKLKEALEMYRTALQKAGHKPTVEEKIAKLTIELSEIAKQEEFRAWLREHPKYRPKGKNPSVAALASMAIPGAGQVYNGDFAKGVALFVISLLSLAGWLTPMLEAFEKAAKNFGVIHINSLIEIMRNWSTAKLIWLLVMIIVCALAWTYSIIEAGITALQMRKVVELEFEEAFRRHRHQDDEKSAS